jgi:hypothetical protein
MEIFSGPLGSHANYITHIALPNLIDYEQLKQKNSEEGRAATPDKYKEFRLFLSALESFNNILDYLYYEKKSEIRQSSLREFKTVIFQKHPVLNDLNRLSDAYKHCIREKFDPKQKKMVAQPDLPWAKDLQSPLVHVNINLRKSKPGATINYEFKWPIEQHENALNEAYRFWLNYHQSPKATQFWA